VVTPEKVMAQVERYDQIDKHSHLYGAIIASVTNFTREKKEMVLLRLKNRTFSLKFDQLS
jgi:hypothetical protein